MLKFLISIPGPWFILVFIIFTAVVMAVASLALSGIKGKNYVFPKELKPYELALLRNGYKAVIEVALFSLVKKKLIEIQDGYSTPIKVTNYKDNNVSFNFKITRYSEPVIKVINYQESEDSIERLILKENIKENKRYIYVYILLKNKKVRKQVKELLAKSVEKLEGFRLIEGRKMKIKRALVKIVALLLVEGLGITKLILGIYREKPIGILLFLVMFNFVLILYVFRAREVHITGLGKEYLKIVSYNISNLKEEIKNEEYENIYNIAMVCAVFGVAPFMGIDEYKELVYPVEATNHDGSSGCSGGGGCSSDGGSGSGCGGCGGCGGGGGD